MGAAWLWAAGEVELIPACSIKLCSDLQGQGEGLRENKR